MTQQPVTVLDIAEAIDTIATRYDSDETPASFVHFQRTNVFDFPGVDTIIIIDDVHDEDGNMLGGNNVSDEEEISKFTFVLSKNLVTQMMNELHEPQNLDDELSVMLAREYIIHHRTPQE